MGPANQRRDIVLDARPGARRRRYQPLLFHICETGTRVFGLQAAKILCPLRYSDNGLLDRSSALLLLEQVGDNVAARGQPDLVALDFGNEPAGDEMVVLLMADAAVRANQLDSVLLDPIDRAEM